MLLENLGVLVSVRIPSAALSKCDFFSARETVLVYGFLLRICFCSPELDKTDCNDSTVSLFDFSGDDPGAICSDIDAVKASSPLPCSSNGINLFPSTVHVKDLHKRNGYNRVSITTKPETKIMRWNTIADLREIKPARRRKKQLQFKREGCSPIQGSEFHSLVSTLIVLVNVSFVMTIRMGF